LKSKAMRPGLRGDDQRLPLSSCTAISTVPSAAPVPSTGLTATPLALVPSSTTIVASGVVSVTVPATHLPGGIAAH
jgi:hypothetical protein